MTSVCDAGRSARLARRALLRGAGWVMPGPAGVPRAAAGPRAASVPGCPALRVPWGSRLLFCRMMPRMMRGMVSGRCGCGRGSCWLDCRRGSAGGGSPRRCSRDVFRLTDRRVSPGFLRLFPGLTFASENSGLCPIPYDVLEMKEQVETAPSLVHMPTVIILTPYGCGFSALSSVYRLNPWSQSKELDRQVEKAKF